MAMKDFYEKKIEKAQGSISKGGGGSCPQAPMYKPRSLVRVVAGTKKVPSLLNGVEWRAQEKFAVLLGKLWRLHMSREFSRGTLNNNQSILTSI